ncbi:MAG: PilN domain-containing protein, partial [Bradyrhizobium sp.]|nr:PilN domain-containing protein [Bradyrhizobium sp.]
PLISGGDHKARMDTLLYGSEHEAALRAARRLGAGHVALAKARIATYRKAPNSRALLDAVPHELHGDAGYIFSRIQLLRRDEKFAEAAQLMLNAPKDPGRLHNLDEWWIERRLLSRKISERRAALRLDLQGTDSAALRGLQHRKQETAADVLALDALSRVLPDNTYVTELRMDKDKLQIAGTSQDAAALVRLIEQSAHFKHATFSAPTTRSVDGTGERFRIEADIKPHFGPGT